MPVFADPQSLHRIARTNYFPRAVSFIAVFIGILLLSAERDLRTTSLFLAVLSFLIYPHLAFLHTRVAADSRRAELTNLAIDPALLGLWAAAMGFNLWLTFMLFTATTLNSAVVGGVGRMALAAGIFILAALLWVLWAGFDFQPNYTTWFAIYVGTLSAGYMLSVGLILYRQYTQLSAALQTINRNNEIFRSLLEVETLSSEADDIADLTDRMLTHFERDHPGFPFGLLLFEKRRPRQLVHAGFRNLDQQHQDEIVQALGANGKGDAPSTFRVGDDYMVVVIPMGHHLDQAAGYLVICDRVASAFSGVIDLFVDRLASAVQNKLLMEELRKTSETDALTGLFNRGYFDEHLAAAIARKRQYPSADFSVIVFDVIGLKRTNDTLGHQAGDQLICTIAERLRRSTRDSDLVARFGGDEFVVLCPTCREDDVGDVVERLQSAARSSPIEIQLPDGRSSEIPAEISVGAAGSDCHEPSQVLQTADRRMYADKAGFYKASEENRS